MEKLFVVIALCVLCTAFERPPATKVMCTCNDGISTEEFTDESEFIPGGFWPCDWIPHPHIPNKKNEPEMA